MATTNERWLPVNWRGFEKHYSVSSLGRIRSEITRPGTTAGKIKSCFAGQHGYVLAALSVGGVNHRVGLHQLVALAFIPNPEGKRCVNHKNGNRADNRVENLNWMTHKENSQHAMKDLGWAEKRKRGSAHFRAKVTEAIVMEIRRKAAAGVMLKDIAAEVGLNASTVSSIVARRYWKHI